MGALTTSALASEVLRFKKPSSYKHNLVIEHIKSAQNQTDVSYQIADIDLNNDFISEYIVKPSSCIENTLCTHHILALPDHTPLNLGSIETSRITIDFNSLYGVRDIKSYNNPENNFRYILLQWDPFSSKYKTSSEQ